MADTLGGGAQKVQDPSAAFGVNCSVVEMPATTRTTSGTDFNAVVLQLTTTRYDSFLESFGRKSDKKVQNDRTEVLLLPTSISTTRELLPPSFGPGFIGSGRVLAGLVAVE
jgi:hypothetical protein